MINGLQQIANLVINCAGPYGSPCFVADRASDPVLFRSSINVLSASLRVLESQINATLPEVTMYRWLVHHIIGHVERYLDGGWLFASVFANTILNVTRQATRDGASAVTLPIAAHHVEVVANWVEYLFSNSVRDATIARMGTLNDLTTIASTLVVSVKNKYQRKLVGSAIVQCCTTTAEGSALYPQRVLVHVGGSCGKICDHATPHIRRGITLRRRLPEHALMDGRTSLATLLFSCELCDDENSLNVLIGAILRLDIKLVASQRTITPTLSQILREMNVVALERLSLRHIHAFRLVSNATLLSDLAQLFSLMGTGSLPYSQEQQLLNSIVGHVRLLQLYQNEELIVEGDNSKVVTLIVPTEMVINTSSEDVLLTELTIAIQVTCRLFASLYIVPGGGVFEDFTADYLFRRSTLESDLQLRDISLIVARVLRDHAQILRGDYLLPEWSPFDQHSDVRLKTVTSTDMYRLLREVVSPVFGASDVPLKQSPVNRMTVRNDVFGDDFDDMMDVCEIKVLAVVEGLRGAALLLRTGAVIALTQS